MILNCKKFDVEGYPVIMGHDRDTGKRYYVIEVTGEKLQDLPWYLTSTLPILEKIKSIFWIK